MNIAHDSWLFLDLTTIAIHMSRIHVPIPVRHIQLAYLAETLRDIVLYYGYIRIELL